MSDLDVALRLRLVNLMSGGAAEAVSDLNKISAAGEKINRMRAAGEKIPASRWVEIQQEAKAIKGAQAAFDDYFKSIDKRIAQIGQMQWAFSELRRMGENIAKPIENATDAAVEFEKRIQSIAKAGGMLGGQKQIGDDILRAAKAGNISWAELARGERQLVALGGGDYLDKIGGVREGLAKLIKASESDSGDLYNLLYHYMHLAKMSPQEALSAMQVNYLQGKKGALELKDLAELMPRMIPLAQEYMSNKQVSTELVALLEVLRKQTGSASEAETRARHMMTKLSDPAEAKKISKELDLDIYAIRKNAAAKGQNQLFAVLDAITAKFKELGDAAGHVKESPLGPDHEGSVEGADPKKLGAIGRDYYFRAGLEAYMKMKDEIKDYLPGADEAAKTTLADFTSTANTAAAALERLSIAADEARIRAGDTQLPVKKAVAGAEQAAAEGVGWFAKNFPTLTSIFGTGEAAVGSALSGVSGGAQTYFNLLTGGLALKLALGKLYQWRVGGAEGAATGNVATKVAPEAAKAAAAASAAEALPSWISGIAPVIRSTMIATLPMAISDALDQHVIDKPEFMKKVRADEAEEDKRRREGNPLNAVMRPDAANAIQDFWNRLRGAISGEGGGSATEAGKMIGDAVAKGAATADMAPAGQETMTKYASALQAAGAKAVAAVDAIVAQLKSRLDFTATPTIKPRLAPATPSSGGGGATPQQHAARTTKNSVHIAQAHFHGVHDVASLHRKVMAHMNSHASAVREASLHDIDIGGVG